MFLMSQLVQLSLVFQSLITKLATIFSLLSEALKGEINLGALKNDCL